VEGVEIQSKLDKIFGEEYHYQPDTIQ